MPRIDPGPPQGGIPLRVNLGPGDERVAIGPSVDPALMLAGYRTGQFAMPLADGLFAWWSPDPRGVLPLHNFHLSRSLRRSMRHFTVTSNAAFEEVLEACADPTRPGHWIDKHLLRAYRQLHRMGWAHSIEVWADDGVLAGGLFGVEVGGLFAGESMFHRRTDGSKAAMAALVTRLRAAGGKRLVDVQWWTPHLGSMGVVEVTGAQYQQQLHQVLQERPCFE